MVDQRAQNLLAKKLLSKNVFIFFPLRLFSGFSMNTANFVRTFNPTQKVLASIISSSRSHCIRRLMGAGPFFGFANVVLPCFWCRSYRGEQALNADVTQTWHQGSLIVISTHWITCGSDAIFGGSSGLYEVNVRGGHF